VAADLDHPLAKPRDTVETPLGRIGLVTAVLPAGRREVQYLDLEGGMVELRADLLRVRKPAKPVPWPTGSKFT
jgi:hypothetical protein